MAVSVGREGINTLLVASQVALSVVLPFIAFPLIYLTSSEVVMRVRKPPQPLVEIEEMSIQDESRESIEIAQEQESKAMAHKVETASVVIHETIDYSNGRLLSAVSYAIWSVVLVANVYAIVMLAMRKTH